MDLMANFSLHIRLQYLGEKIVSTFSEFLATPHFYTNTGMATRGNHQQPVGNRGEMISSTNQWLPVGERTDWMFGPFERMDNSHTDIVSYDISHMHVAVPPSILGTDSQ